MFQKTLSNPLTSPPPIWFPKPKPPNRVLIVRSHVADSSNRTESGSDSNPNPSKLFESAAVSAGAYPGGMGLQTGRDPNVKKPEWLRQRAPQGEKFARLQESLSKLKLNTVCVEAQCPNIGEELKPEILVECLTSDFRGDLEAVSSLVHSGLDVFAHNIETVKRLQRIVRDPRAGYEQSLTVLKHAKFCKEGMITKSSIMLGLGESDEEVKEAMADLRAIGVDILTLGQYLQPTPLHLTVKEYVTPEKFAFWKTYGESIGFKYVASGPLVRSSYRAGELFVQNLVRGKKTMQESTSSGS